MEKASENNSISWEPISTDEKGFFNHDQLTYGGLFLEYYSSSKQIMIFDGLGHGKVYINGVPREGYHFGFGTTKNPVILKKGLNTFYLRGGRIPKKGYPLCPKIGNRSTIAYFGLTLST